MTLFETLVVMISIIELCIEIWKVWKECHKK